MPSSKTASLTKFGLGGIALAVAGATFSAALNLGGNDITRIGTASGAVLKAGGGRTVINVTGVVSKNTISGATLTTNGTLPGRVACITSGGVLSYCQGTPAANGCGCK